MGADSLVYILLSAPSTDTGAGGSRAVFPHRSPGSPVTGAEFANGHFSGKMLCPCPRASPEGANGTTFRRTEPGGLTSKWPPGSPPSVLGPTIRNSRLARRADRSRAMDLERDRRRGHDDCCDSRLCWHSPAYAHDYRSGRRIITRASTYGCRLSQGRVASQASARAHPTAKRTAALKRAMPVSMPSPVGTVGPAF